MIAKSPPSRWRICLLLALLVASVVVTYRTRPRDLGRELRYAAFQGDASRVEQLLRRHPELINLTSTAVPRPHIRRNSPAARQNIVEEFTLFLWEKLILKSSTVLQQDERFEYMEADHLSPLHIACEKRDVALVRLLLEHGADVHQKSLSQYQAVLWAARGPPELMKMLLSHGASPFATNLFGYTPLHWSIHNQDSGVMRLLLDAGADPNYQNRHGSTALHIAAGNVQRSNACVVLLQHGARPDVVDRAGKTPVDVALLTRNTDIARILTSSIPAKTARP